MTEHIEDGGPAFPREAYVNPNGVVVHAGCQGMTLRDWFAGQALAALYRQSFMPGVILREDYEQWSRELAAVSYIVADAMIAESKGGKA